MYLPWSWIHEHTLCTNPWTDFLHKPARCHPNQQYSLAPTPVCLPCAVLCCAVDLDKIVAKTDGYSGSDMRNLIQEACQGPVRSAVASHGEAVASLCDADLRPVSPARKGSALLEARSAATALGIQWLCRQSSCVKKERHMLLYQHPCHRSPGPGCAINRTFLSVDPTIGCRALPNTAPHPVCHGGVCPCRWC